MNVICIDDEYLILQRNMTLLKKIPQVESVEIFLSSQEALEYLETNEADIVFLDINMPDISGLELAETFRERWPDMAIIFLTAYNQFALNAFKVHANGYLIKPVEQEQFEEEIRSVEKLRGGREKEKVKVITFGNFDLFIRGQNVAFARSLSKEILAYLICKNGTSVSRPELASVLWEDEPYDRARQKQLDVYIRSLMTTLAGYGIERIVEKSSGSFRIRPEYLDCDYYQYLKGEAAAHMQYTGEFLNNYSWAEYWKKPFLEQAALHA